jgi:hypothetical protein
LIGFIHDHFLKCNNAHEIIVSVIADITAIGFYRKMGFKSINANLDGTINITRNLIHPDHYDFEINPKKLSTAERYRRKNKARKIRHKCCVAKSFKLQ